MKHLGRRIWEEWCGAEIPGLGLNDLDAVEDALVYYAYGTWGEEDEDEMLGLATTLQRDGVGVDRQDSILLVTEAEIHQGYAAAADEAGDESSLTETDEDGRCLCHGWPVAHEIPRRMTWALIRPED